MSTVVFILGAGASRDCGGPLMGDFLDIAHDLELSNRLTIAEKIQFAKVFTAISALQSVHSKAKLDTYNIESVFTTLELAQIIQRLPGIKVDEIPGTIEALKTVIARTLELRIRFPLTDDGIQAPEPYGQFVELVSFLIARAHPRQTVSIITFNYDVAIDVALLRANIPVDYAIETPAQEQNPREKLPLLKLHGSLNWAVEESAPNSVRPLDLQQYFRERDVAVTTPSGDNKEIYLSILPRLVSFFEKRHSLKVKPLPYIVPPSWNKADYHKALTNVWASAAQQLSEALYIFVIGYSLPSTDSFFRQLYALGSAGPARLRKIVVYDPDPTGGVDARFKDLLGTGVTSRYEPEKRDFKNAIAHIRSIFGP
jgi:SIR2-like domain